MAITKKDKSLSRAERKIRKRKLEQAISDLPGDVNITDLQSVSSLTIEGGANSFKKPRLEKTPYLGKEYLEGGTGTNQLANSNERKKWTKSNNNASNSEYRTRLRPDTTESLDGNFKDETVEPEDSASLRDDQLLAKISKRERKAQRKASEAAHLAVGYRPESDATENVLIAGGREDPMRKSKKNNRNREKNRKGGSNNRATNNGDGKAHRFIVFIGNLPFSATTESIQKHFAAVHPKFIRHLTMKDEPEKSKGCAFLEFEGYDHMKACLKSFHHSTFDDSISPPRKINVELTAGGGGNKQNRHTKITEKNQKLNEQRIRRMHEEEKVKLVKRGLAIDHSDVHPSRRERVPDIS